MSGSDPALSIVSSMYIHFGLLGVLLFMLTIGVVIRLLTGWIVHIWGQAGQALILGSTCYMSIAANSFTSIITGLRNFFIIVVIMFVVAAVQKSWFGRQGKPSKSIRLPADQGRYVRSKF
jgi:hypothetical protein